MTDTESLFDTIRWRDPISGRPLEPIVLARTPAGVPICGALRVSGTDTAYPIVDCVARITPELAQRYRAWLTMMNLAPAGSAPDQSGAVDAFQAETTVDSFGFQWGWNANPRTETDLRHRVADKFHAPLEMFAGLLTLDAGAGAGDQTAYMLEHGAEVISVDLSAAIEVVSRKHRMNRHWFGVQGDVTNLPFDDQQFGLVYCEGVIQHTQDSPGTVAELVRVLRVGGRVHAAHYVWLPPKGWVRRLRRRLSSSFYGRVRRRLSAMERYKLLLLSGILAALSYVPLVGWFIRRSGLALRSPFTDDLLMTWTATYDLWGGHAYQRYITPEEFWGYFGATKVVEAIHVAPGVVVGRRVA